MNKSILYRLFVLLMIVSLVQMSCQAVSVETLTPSEEAAGPTEQPPDPTETGVVEPSPEVVDTATLPPQPTQSPVTAAGDTWLVMLYQDADDPAIEAGLFFDFNEAELVGSTDQVKIVSQIDLYEGGQIEILPTDVTSTRRYLIQQNYDLLAIGSELIQDLGEINNGDWRTLVDFAVWAIQSYPADHYVLVLSDHGGGWTGGMTDPAPAPAQKMTTDQIDQAFSEIVAQTNIGQFEIIGFDACLMAQMEILSILAPYARYAVFSEESIPSLGWAYTEPLAQLTQNPTMSGAELAQLFVNTYIDQDIQIVNDQLRQLLLNGKGLPPETSAAELAASYQDVTLTAVDLAASANLHTALNNLVIALTQVDQGGVAQARAYSQMYESVFQDFPESFMDVGHFTSLLLEVFPSDQGILQAVQQVQDAIQQSVILERHGTQRAGSTGLAIFFPNSDLFAATASSDSGFPIYVNVAGRFATASLWDEYLRFFYMGEPFNPAAVDLTVLDPVTGQQMVIETPEPQQLGEVVSPGAGPVVIDPLVLSADQIGSEESVIINTRIQSNNIAYIYIYAFYQDPDTGSVITMDIDYIDSETIREVGGVYYPDWGSEPFDLEYEWTPTVYYLSNGQDETFALFEPAIYGQGADDTYYVVRGYFAFANADQRYYSEMFFNANGDFNSLWVYSGEENSAAIEVYPSPGDQFTVIEDWLEFDQNPDGDLVEYDGGTLVFTEAPMRFIPYTPVGGMYAVGIFVEDMDGNFTYQLGFLNVLD